MRAGVSGTMFRFARAICFDALVLAQGGLVELELGPVDVELARLPLQALEFDEQVARLVAGVHQRQRAGDQAARVRTAC